MELASCVAKQLGLLLNEEELLRSEYRTRPRNSDPSDELLSGNLEVLHRVQPYQGACAAKPCLAMNGNSTWVRLAEMPVAHTQKIVYNIFGRV